MGYGEYIALRTKAMVLPNNGGYDIAKAESNPEFFVEFVGDVMERENLPAVIWEPFAGHTGKSKTQDFAALIGFKLVSFDMAPCDPMVQKQDSTVTGPGETIGGMFFHPPYFGTMPLSEDDRDLSLISKWDDYVKALRKTVLISSLTMQEGGLVCAVGRDYRHAGERIRLDLEYLKLFESNSFVLQSVLESEPDVGLIFRKVGL